MKMLDCEGVQPEKLGYDRPSPKLLGFLNKYFGLNSYVPQNNNFVVYKDYFVKNTTKNSSNKTYSDFNQKNTYTIKENENTNNFISSKKNITENK